MPLEDIRAYLKDQKANRQKEIDARYKRILSIDCFQLVAFAGKFRVSEHWTENKTTWHIVEIFDEKKKVWLSFSRCDKNELLANVYLPNNHQKETTL